MFHNTDDFDTFILFSPPFTGDVEPDYENPALKEKNIFFGYGDYDFVATRSLYKQAMDADGNPVDAKQGRAKWEWEYNANGRCVNTIGHYAADL